MPRISSAGAITARGAAGAASAVTVVPSPVRRAGQRRSAMARSEDRLAPSECRALLLLVAVTEGVLDARLERPSLHVGNGLVELGLDVGGDEGLEGVERRQADGVGRDVEAEGAALVGTCGDLLDRRRDGVLELLLGADHGARARGRAGQELVDVDADGMDLGIAGGLQDAVAGRSGDLEQDVDVLVGREELPVSYTHLTLPSNREV